MEPVDRKTVLPAKVTTFIEQRKTGDMPGDMAEDKGGAVVEMDPFSGNGNDARIVIRLRPSFQKFT